MRVYTMDYASLEEAYGSAFGQRVPVAQQRAADAIEKPLQVSKPIEQRGAESIEKNRSLIDSVKKTIGYEEPKVMEPFAIQSGGRERVTMRERFTGSQPVNVVTDFDQAEKIARILRLIEQNKTGYERPAVQDMVLYIATGIFFLFTFDTFVVLGKSMRGK
jgi:hypothetical protein